MINKKGLMPFFTPTGFVNELTTSLSPDSLPPLANADTDILLSTLCKQWFWPLFNKRACLQASGRHRNAKYSILFLDLVTF